MYYNNSLKKIKLDFSLRNVVFFSNRLSVEHRGFVLVRTETTSIFDKPAGCSGSSVKNKKKHTLDNFYNYNIIY